MKWINLPAVSKSNPVFRGSFPLLNLSCLPDFNSVNLTILLDAKTLTYGNISAAVYVAWPPTSSTKGTKAEVE
jgi:hypothetical protein